ncbi:MAG: hypothetical protein NT099_07465 [Candidatus Saganbacteria bacterium]|nr:hypothetical protein [Candidatus Saganbacteria bacterium]
MKKAFICLIASLFVFSLFNLAGAELLNLPKNIKATAVKIPVLPPKSSLSKVQKGLSLTPTNLNVNMILIAGDPKNVPALTNVQVWVIEFGCGKNRKLTYNMDNCQVWFSSVPFIPQSKTFVLNPFTQTPKPKGNPSGKLGQSWIDGDWYSSLKEGDEFYALIVYGDPTKLCVSQDVSFLPSTGYYSLNAVGDSSKNEVLAVFPLIANGTNLQMRLVVTDNLSANIYNQY